MTEKNRIVYETLMKVKNFTKGVSKVQAGFKKLSNLATCDLQRVLWVLNY